MRGVLIEHETHQQVVLNRSNALQEIEILKAPIVGRLAQIHERLGIPLPVFQKRLERLLLSTRGII